MTSGPATHRLLPPAWLLAAACVVAAADRLEPLAARPVADASWPAVAGAESLRLERLGSEHGLSHNAVFAILQDAQGFLWFGTQDGLDRYDGHEFVVFRHDPEDPRTVSSNWITALLEDRTGTLWIGSRGGLDRMTAGGDFERFPPAGDPGNLRAPAAVTALAEDPSGTLWVGTEMGLAIIPPDRSAVHPYSGELNTLATDPVRAIQVAPDGDIWVLTDQSLDRSMLHRLGEDEEPFLVPQTWAFHLDASGDLWLDTAGPTALERTDSPSRADVPAFAASAFMEDSRGHLWIGTFNGLWRRPAGTDVAVRIPTADFDEGGGFTNEIITIAEDRAGSVWMATHGGVLRDDPHRKAFHHIGHDPGKPGRLSASNAVSSIHEDEGGRLWVGTYGTGLDEIDPLTGAVRHHRRDTRDPTSLCDDYIYDLAPSTRSTLWIGASSGLCSLASDGFRAHDLGRDIGRVATLGESPDGRTLWLGTFLGLFAYEPGTADVRFLGDDAAGLVKPVDALHVAPDGTVWLGSSVSGDLAAVSPATGAIRSFRGIESAGIWDIASTVDGTLWLATGGGAIHFDPTTGVARRLAPSIGEGGSVYYSVVADLAGRLWFGTNRSLVRYDPARPEEGIRSYDVGDGLGNVEFNRHAAHRTGSGVLIFGGMSGLTILDPEAIRDNPYVPPVVLTGVDILSRSGERAVNPAGLDRLTLRPDDYTVSFEFAALNFTQGHKNRYAYMLEGFDEDWIADGTSRFVRYTSLPAGTYRFRVRGSNNDGLWNTAGTALTVSVLPPFWQTWWFRTAVVVALAGLVAGAHRARIRRLVALQEMRFRIARDLHDELGSELSGIALASAMIGRQDHLTERDRRRLADVSSSALQVMEGLRDIVWYINPEHDTLVAMEQRMKALAEKLLSGRSYRFSSDVPASARLEMHQRQHLLPLFKELLHNVVRHAAAGQVTIDLRLKNDTLSLTVEDDGAGFESSAETAGTGLKNLRRRADDMGGRLTIHTSPGRGTRAHLTAPMTRTRRGADRGRAVP